MWWIANRFGSSFGTDYRENYVTLGKEKGRNGEDGETKYSRDGIGVYAQREWRKKQPSKALS